MLAIVAVASAVRSASLCNLPRASSARGPNGCATQRSKPAAMAALAFDHASASWPASEPIGQPPRACRAT